MAEPDPPERGDRRDPFRTTDEMAVLAANAAFYDAFERRDLDAMSDIWEHSDRVSCVHPGWSILTGWASVSASWFALFDGPQRLQFIVTDERPLVVGDLAWVTCNENLLDEGSTQAVAATNLYERIDDRWVLLHHHGSPVVQRHQGRDS